VAAGHLIFTCRLSETYLKWTCLRRGTNLSVINHKSWGRPQREFLARLDFRGERRAFRGEN